MNQKLKTFHTVTSGNSPACLSIVEFNCCVIQGFMEKLDGKWGITSQLGSCTPLRSSTHIVSCIHSAKKSLMVHAMG